MADLPICGMSCDVCKEPMERHGPAMEHPPAFGAGMAYERERCAKIADWFQGVAASRIDHDRHPSQVDPQEVAALMALQIALHIRDVPR